MMSIDTVNTNATLGETLVKLGAEIQNLVIVEADLAKASGSLPFKAAYPDRYYDVGIAEQNLVGFAAGLAASGMIPIVTTFACFASQRACDQAMNSVAYNGFDVKIIGTAAGLTNEKNGGTHISVADVAIFRAMPHFLVVDPGDAVEYAAAVSHAAMNKGPVYIRANKGDYPVFHAKDYVFIPGKAETLSTGKDIGIITSGLTTGEAILASERLEADGISTYHIHMPSIKPFDKEAVRQCASNVKTIISIENHSVIGGLGSAVAEALAECGAGCRLIRLGLQDCFGETATRAYQMHKNGIDADGICKTVKTCLKK